MNEIKVLLIEDSDSHAMLVEEMLSEMSQNRFSVERFVRLSEGIKRMEETEFDVVLLDLSLPDSKGLDTFLSMKKRAPSLPVVILTVTEDDVLTAAALRGGAQDYLLKGYLNSSMLVKSIRYAIERQKRDTEKEQMLVKIAETQKMEAVVLVAEGIAHDFNNLLSSIQVVIEEVMLDIDKNSRAYSDLTNLGHSMKFAETLIQQLLIISRSHKLELKRISLKEPLAEIIMIFENLLGKKYTFLKKIDRDLKPAVADKSLIEQIVMNAVLNSRDAMPDGGKIIISAENINISEADSVRFKSGLPGEYVRLLIEDEGCGIPAEHMERIFDPFFTTKIKGKGTGLGLAVILNIAKSLGGFVHIESLPARGTRLQVYLPAAVIPDEEEINSKKYRLPEPKTCGRILFVEDEETLRNAVTNVLERSGYTVTSAKTAKEAKEIFNTGSGGFDLVLSDIILPEMSGLDLVDEIRRSRPDIGVVLCSGYYDSDTWDRIKEKGYEVLKKPFHLYDLQKIIQKVLK